MAVLIPPDPPADGPGKQAERRLFEALRTLPDAYFVYGGYRFVEGERALEGEADFLVLHRERGLLLLECKGYGVKRTAEGRWIRMYNGSESPLKKDPFAQAEDGCHNLVKSLEKGLERMGRHGPFPLPFGYAVAFPAAARGEGLLPPGIPQETLYDSWDVARLAERIPQTLEFWARRKGAGACAFPEFDRFRKKVLHPKLDLVPGLGPDLAGGEAVLRRLTREQAWVMEALLDNRRLRVDGGAGTGKTVMALEVVRRLAEGGERTLLLCFNRALGAHLSDSVASWGLPPGAARATYFHDLCREAFLALGRDYLEPEEPREAERFFNHEAPEVLVEALEAGHLGRWDAVVVDEGQDFAPSWWLPLEGKLAPRGAGRLMVFYDPAQAIFGRECTVPMDLPVLRLRRNLRNARPIAEVVCRLGGGDLRPHEESPEGEPVTVVDLASVPDPAAALDGAAEELLSGGMVADQLVVLTPHRLEHSSLAGREELGGVPLSRDPRSREGAILHATISGFKGLESDAVLLADVDPDDPRCSRDARYVGASRARLVLRVFARGDWLA